MIRTQQSQEGSKTAEVLNESAFSLFILHTLQFPAVRPHNYLISFQEVGTHGEKNQILYNKVTVSPKTIIFRINLAGLFTSAFIGDSVIFVPHLPADLDELRFQVNRYSSSNFHLPSFT